MTSRFPVLLSSGALSPAYRWRLVGTLYAQQRSLVEGSLAAAATSIVCLVRTGWAGYGALIVLSLLILAARLLQKRSFDRRVAARTPEYWAWQFIVGAGAAASVWSLTDLAVLVQSHDTVLQLFVFMVQAGWLGGTSIRNAVSPACVAVQVTAGVLFTCGAFLLVPFGFIWMISPFALVLARAAFNIARQLGQDTIRAMLSEQQLEEANARLTEISTTDSLTGIGNRRAIDSVLAVEWGRAARDGSELGFLMIDVDHFKLYNDRYGHPAGDECLRAIAAAVDGTLRRPPDFAGRFGGEEFVAVLPGTGAAGACEVAERARQAVQQLDIPHAASPFERVTISVGAASMAPRPGGNAQDLIDLADRALYDAKQGGRNRVRLAAAQLAILEKQ